MGFVKVAKKSDISNGTMKGFVVDGHRILITNVDGNFSAIDGACSHKGANLDEGALDGTTVTCPWHAAQYDVKTGKIAKVPFDQSQFGAVKDQKTFAVKIEGDDILVEV